MMDAPPDSPDGDGAPGERDAPDAVVLPIEDALDLHAFLPRDVPSVVEEYLSEAVRRGFSEVRLIHGRGVGVQRAVVQGLLGRDPRVIRFFDAPPERGGWGATVVILKPDPTGSEPSQPTDCD